MWNPGLQCLLKKWVKLLRIYHKAVWKIQNPVCCRYRPVKNLVTIESSQVQKLKTYIKSYNNQSNPYNYILAKTKRPNALHRPVTANSYAHSSQLTSPQTQFVTPLCQKGCICSRAVLSPTRSHWDCRYYGSRGLCLMCDHNSAPWRSFDPILGRSPVSLLELVYLPVPSNQLWSPSFQRSECSEQVQDKYTPTIDLVSKNHSTFHQGLDVLDVVPGRWRENQRRMYVRNCLKSTWF